MRLPVFAEGAPVGEFLNGEEGPSFRYAAAWQDRADAFPVSLAMPLSLETAGPDIAAPWLMNLLPEGGPRRAMTRALGLGREDIAGLVSASGRDLAGALSFQETGPDAGYSPIEDGKALERIMEELPARPFLVGDEGVAMSLAGAQDKLPLRFVDGSFSVPVNGAASTHILKPDNPRLPGSVQNEALCMVLARHCGLPAAEVTTGQAGARSYLLVTRYDRVVRRNVGRLHQEDFCQALGRPPVAKYQHNGTGRQGVTLADMFTLIREQMTARDTNRFFEAVIFNTAIGNVDAHAKNYSILLRPEGPSLAPLYDLMSGLAWAGITENQAQDIGGQRRGRYIFGCHWRRMTQAAGISGTATLRRVEMITAQILEALPLARAEVAAMTAGEGVLLSEFEAQIAARARTVALNLRGEEGPDPPDELPDPGVRYDR
jgi:serine/threonine-protein kinase HipA